MTLTARHPSESPRMGVQALHHPQAHHHGWHGHSRKVAPLPAPGDLPSHTAQAAHMGGPKHMQGKQIVVKPGSKGEPALSHGPVVVRNESVLSPSAFQTIVVEELPPADHWEYASTTTTESSATLDSSVKGGHLLSSGRFPVPMSPASSITTSTSSASGRQSGGSHHFRSFSVSRPKVVYPTDVEQMEASQPRQRSLPRDPVPHPQAYIQPQSQAQPQPQRQATPRSQGFQQPQAMGQSQAMSHVMAPPAMQRVGVVSHQPPPPPRTPPQPALIQPASFSHHTSFSLHTSFVQPAPFSQQPASSASSQLPPLSQQPSHSTASQLPPLSQQPSLSSLGRQLSFGRGRPSFLSMRSLSVKHANPPVGPEALPNAPPSAFPSRPSTGLVSSASISHASRRRAEAAAAQAAAAHAAAQHAAAQGTAGAPRLQHLTSAQLHVSRKGQYDVVAVAFWIVVLEGGCELQVMRGRSRKNIQEPGAPAGGPSAAAAARPSTASGVRRGAGGAGLGGGRLQWDTPMGLTASQDLEGFQKGGAGNPNSFWEKVTGVGKGAPAVQFTLHLDRSPYPLLSWTHNGLFGASNKLVRLYTANRVDAGEWEFVLETSKGPLFLKAPSRDWYLVWTEGVRAILRYAQEISSRRQGSP